MVSRSALVRPSIRLAIASPVEASRSLSSVPLTEIASKMRSPVRDRRSASSPPRMVIVSAMRVPVSSSLSLISWPRSARSTRSESELVLSASLTSLTWRRDRLGGEVAGLRDRPRDFLGAPVEALDQFGADRGQRLVHLAAAIGDGVGHRAAGGLQRVVDVGAPREERVGHFGAGRGERFGDVAHRVGEAGDEVLAARRRAARPCSRRRWRAPR